MQRLINLSWQKGERFECIVGIIAIRMLSYGYSDPMQFIEGNDFDILDFLDTFNSHTGALDMLTSSWAAVLAGGWPIFREFMLVSRKVQAYTEDASFASYPRLQGRENECDSLDSEEDVEYRKLLRSGERPTLGVSSHMRILRRGSQCPIGTAVAFLCIALELVRKQSMYQGSLADASNLVYTLVIAAQDSITSWAETKQNWSPFFDLLTTQWPIWELLSDLACVDTNRTCLTRSELQCFDPVLREVVPCPHAAPKSRVSFAACGEHDICTWPAELQSAPDWCVPFSTRPPSPLEPWILGLGHDDEERICAQCGQDGILRTIFAHIGFRDVVGPTEMGGSPPFFVEFGARKPDMLNSAVLRRFCNWDGVLLDSQPGETPHGGCPGCPGVAELVRTEFVTAENIVKLFGKHGVPFDFDLLTVDVDFNDYWIWRSLLVDGTFRPRVVAVDFNPDLPLHEAKVVRYEAEAEWDGTRYTVASLLAYVLLARAHGYAFAYALEMGSHAFFIRDDLLAPQDRDLPIRNVRKSSHLPDAKGRQFVDVLYDFIPDQETKAETSDATIADDSSSGVRNSGGKGVTAKMAALRREVRNLAREVRDLRISLAGDHPPPGRAPGARRPDDALYDANSGEGWRGGGVMSAATRFYDEVRKVRQGG